MSASRSFTLLWTPWSAAVSVLAVGITAGFCLIAWRRSGYRRSTGFLELARLGLVSLVALLLNQPEFIEEFRPENKPAIALLWDASSSMETQDVPCSERNDGTRIARRQAIAAWLEPASWTTLRDRMDVLIEPFSSPKKGSGSGHGSDLHEPLAAAAGNDKHLLGIVFISDGDWNEGAPPVEAAAQLRLKGIPVFAVPVGSTTRLPDVELLSLDAPTFGIAGKSVRIPFSIDSSLPHEYRATVTLQTEAGDELSKEVLIHAMGRTNDWIEWNPQNTGDYTLTMEIPVHSEETLDDNNRLSAPISIREEKLQVLVIESYPRWEYRYLHNALSRDPGIDVACLLFHPGLSKAGGGNKDYIKAFPNSVDALAKFDVVFVGDVGSGDGQLTDLQCQWLKGLVEHQASGLVFMPGWQGRQLSLTETELGDLFPVVLDARQLGGWGSRTPNHFELTELGRRSLLTKLADTQKENTEVWDGLAGFQWYAPVIRARAGSDILCVHRDVSNEFGRLPLVVTRTYGVGKVLFMGTDGAWRWREGVEDKYHYRFWGQVVRWMAYQRHMAKGETMRLYYSPNQPRMRQTVTFGANVMEQSGEPLGTGDVVARIVAPSGKTKMVQFKSTGDAWGAFGGRFRTEEAGHHQVTLLCKQTNATLETSFFVQGVATERIGQPARPEVLEEIARVTRGKVVTPDRIHAIVESLTNLPDPPPTVRRIQLWNHPAVAGAVTALLGVFWIARKTAGLI
ncbi:MAG: hypothetical protein JW829_15105 [Pirellulales bacterium]|nr:hypothetical protein [Pirellulales bacterium]